jgi:hypothetical protein
MAVDVGVLGMAFPLVGPSMRHKAKRFQTRLGRGL